MKDVELTYYQENADKLLTGKLDNTGNGLVKILYNFLTGNSYQLNKVTDKDLENDSILKELSKEIVELIISKSVPTTGKEGLYTTGEIATYVGVSVQTINNWISDGKIHPVTRTNGTTGQYRIPKNAIITTRSGATISVSQLVKDHTDFVRASETMSYEDELANILHEMDCIEVKYSSIQLLIRKENKTDQEEKDLSIWNYWYNRYTQLESHIKRDQVV